MKSYTVSPMLIVALLHLMGTSKCTTVDTRYRVAFQNYRMPQWSIAYQNVTTLRCLVRCSTHATCYYVSYDVIHGNCTLSPWSAPLGSKVAAGGVTLYEMVTCKLCTIVPLKY